MSLDVRSIEESPGLGIEVRGLDAEALDDPVLQQELCDLWTDRGVIVFRELTGPSVHVKLSRCFGELQVHPVGDGKQELIKVQYDAKVRDVYEIDGRLLGGWLPWHFDLAYMSKVNHGGILRPIVLPSTGGETGFIDRISLYESLPTELKDEVEHASVVYKFDINVEHLKFARPESLKVITWSEGVKDLYATQDSRFPAVVHPLVFCQPETGRKVLNFSPWFALEAYGMEKRTGDALLRRLGDHVLRHGAPYYHRWRADDMVLWDNWRMLHCASGMPSDENRLMERTTIAGDYGLGYLAPALEPSEFGQPFAR
jgi:taurine dioxygenase